MTARMLALGALVCAVATLAAFVALVHACSYGELGVEE